MEHRFEACREYWQTLLAVTEGNVTHAAQIAGVYRTDVYKRLQRYGVALPRNRPSARRGKWED